MVCKMICSQYLYEYMHFISLRHVDQVYENRSGKPIILVCVLKRELHLYKYRIGAGVSKVVCLCRLRSRYAFYSKRGLYDLFDKFKNKSFTKTENKCDDILHGGHIITPHNTRNLVEMQIWIQRMKVIGRDQIADNYSISEKSSTFPLLREFVFHHIASLYIASLSLLLILIMLCILNMLQSSKLCYQFSFDETSKCSNGSNSNHNISKQSIPFVLLFSILLRKALQISTLGAAELFSGKRLVFSYVPQTHLHTSYKTNDRVIFKSLLKQLLLPLKTSQDLKVFPIYGKKSNQATINRQQDDSSVPAISMENETVNASARGQQECTTLILGGRMESELLRLSTLCNFPVFGISLLRLAEYGFYSEGNNDELVCYSCGNRARGWTPDSDHSDVKNHYLNCQHVLKKKFPVPLEASSCSEDFKQMGKPDGKREQLWSDNISSDLSIKCTDDGNDEIPANLILSTKNEGQHNNQPRTIGHAMPTETSSKGNGNEVYPNISEKYGLPRGIGYSEQQRNSESQVTGTHESSLMNRSQMSPTPLTREISVDGNTNITDSLNLLSLEPEEQMLYFSGVTQNPRNNLPSVSQQPMIKQNGSLESNQEQLTLIKYDGRMVKMKYPNYEPLQKRRDSYFDWPANRDFLHPYDLAECGFFFTHFEDCVRCFQCGIGLRNWEDNDNVWVEHARWSQKCQYLTKRKGKEFIDTVVQMLGLNTDAENMQSEPLQLEPTDITQSTRNPLEHAASQYVLSENIFDDVELVRVCTISLIETIGWNSITPDLLVDSILDMSAVEEATPIDNKAANSQSHGYKPCMDCPVETRIQTSRGTEIKSLTTESITAVVEIDKTKKVMNQTSEDDPEELQKEIDKMKDLYTCKICLDEKVGVTFLPCGHLVTCAQCSPKLRRCPLCRTFIRSTIQTKI